MKTCPQCGKDFSANASYKAQRYCGRPCYLQGRWGRYPKVCQAAGEDDDGPWDCDKSVETRGLCTGHRAQVRRGLAVQRLKFRLSRSRRDELEAEGLWWCNRCKSIKPLDEFYNPSRVNRAGSNYQCIECSRWAYIYSRFKVTRAQFDYLLVIQGGTCALCPATISNAGTGRLAIDHDHSCCPPSNKSCGKCIRGLLCDMCNLRLVAAYESLPAQLRDSPRLNEYLTRRPLQDMGVAA